MSNRNGLKWNREETILAFELYSRTPYGRIHYSNPDIISLSTALERTPGSVSRKMQNLASYDPELQARGVKGLPHSSKLDGLIFEEFSKDLEELSFQAHLIKEKYGITDKETLSILKDLDDMPSGKYKERLVKTRIGQHAFRSAVLSTYTNRCCITGLSLPEMLVASHIKPWKVSKEKDERTNPQNGLCLNAFHDKAFDLGLITIDKHYIIKVSGKLKKAGMDDVTCGWIMSYANERINLPEKFKPGLEFIEYHTDVIFKP